jgi:Holliday junction DNA helicase RuvB
MLEDLNQIQDSIHKPSSSSINSYQDLRPKSFSTYVGQSKLKEQLQIMISSALQRGACLDHVLFYGLPGMGKTTVAQIIAKELKSNLVITSGQALEKTGDVASILASLSEKDVLFIDEIHRLKPKVEEMLYTAMEDFSIDIVLGKGPTAKVMRMDIPGFTLIGATTRLHKIANPLRDRFGLTLQLAEYNQDEIIEILVNNAELLDIKCDYAALKKIAICSRGTPRVAIHFLKRARDLLLHKDSKLLTDKLADSLLKKFGLDMHGLTDQDRLFIRKIFTDFSSGPVGLSTIAASINDEPENIEDTLEPFLIRLGFLKRTHRGRQLTNKGIEFAKNMV